MEDTNQFLKGIQQKLTTQGSVQQLDPVELDQLLQNFYDVGKHENLLHKLAAHYSVPYKTLTDMLVGRQLIYVHLHTDYTNPGNDQLLSNLLRNQNMKVSEMVERMGSMVSQIDEALRQTEFLRDEAAMVLALYKAQYLKEQKPAANPK
jgi:hypothetical protein